jgi:hypothetical protein
LTMLLPVFEIFLGKAVMVERGRNQ